MNLISRLKKRNFEIRNQWIILYYQNLHYGEWEIFLSVGKHFEFRIKRVQERAGD